MGGGEHGKGGGAQEPITTADAESKACVMRADVGAGRDEAASKQHGACITCK